MTVYPNLFNIEGNFNLYSFENIKLNESKKNILESFKQDYEDLLKTKLKLIGLKYIDLNYFSPKYYNYEGDSLDLEIQIINKEKLKKVILKYGEEINLNLSNNKSYDGYISLTVENIKEELEKIKNKDYELDNLILKTILNNLINFKDFYLYDLLVYDSEDLEGGIK